MAKYSWTDVHQLEDAIASGRFSAEALAAIPGLATFSLPARRDAALAELLANAALTAAVGDGVTDDTVALQAALTAAGSYRGVVRLNDNGLTYKTTSALVLPVGVTLDLGSCRILSSSTRVISLNTYSALISDLINASIQTTSTAAGGVIGNAVLGATGPCYIRVGFILGPGAGNAGMIGLDMTGLHDCRIDGPLTIQGLERGVFGANGGGGGICYRNHFYGVDVILPGTLGWDLNLGSNDWMIIGGQVNTGQCPIDADSVSGLLVQGLNMEGFTVRGPRVTDCTNYLFIGCRTEAGAAALDTYTHAGTSYGAVVNPTIGGLSNEVFNVTGSGFTYISRRTIPGGPVTLTDVASIVVDETLGNVFTVTLTGSHAVAAPTQPIAGQRLTFIVVQDGVGGHALTWNAVFKHAWSDTGNTAGKQSTISFVNDGTNYVQDGAQSPYI